MKKCLLLLALLLAFAPMALAEDAPTAPLLEAEMADVQPETVEAQALDLEHALFADDVLPQSALETAIEEVSSSYECPPYTTYCFKDKQCDSYCGATGAGACEFGCCACLF